MALEIKQTLRLSQQLVITPQLQQAIKLLQLSRLELQNLVQQELVENPVLEETSDEMKTAEESEVETEPEPSPGNSEDQEAAHKSDQTDEVGTRDGELKEPTDFDWENYLGTYNSPEGSAPNMREKLDELPSFENTTPQIQNLDDHLLWQLHLSNLPRNEVEIAEQIICDINDDGYYVGDLADITTRSGVSEEEVEAVLFLIHEFDPLGVGARDLRECLKLQTKPHKDCADLLRTIIDDFLPELERHNYPLISKKMGLPVGRVEELAHIIHMMEPKPGRPFGGQAPQYIIPDVYIHKMGNEYIIMLNDDGMPKLQVSRFYRNAMAGKEVAGKAKEYIQDKLRSAVWLIRSIHQRQRTLYRVTTSIVKFQREFLEQGVSHLRPMVLKDVADDIGMHESTISRVTTNKYAQTPRGIFELKFFFNTRVPSSNHEGLTSEAIKEKIKELIAQEDVTKPYSDQAIADKLKSLTEASVARRTVAKYREILGILPSSRRRRMAPAAHRAVKK